MKISKNRNLFESSFVFQMQKLSSVRDISTLENHVNQLDDIKNVIIYST